MYIFKKPKKTVAISSNFMFSREQVVLRLRADIQIICSLYSISVCKYLYRFNGRITNLIFSLLKGFYARLYL